MTRVPVTHPDSASDNDKVRERGLDDKDMHRFLPPRAPLAMPVQELTPRFGLRRVLFIDRAHRG